MKHLLYILLFFSVSVTAQTDHINLDKAKVGKVKRQGKQALLDEDYYVALEYYIKLHEERPDDLKVTYQLAQLYQNARDYKQAEELYQKVVDAKDDDFAEAIFHLGVVQKNNKKYAQAAETLGSLKRNLKFIEDKSIIRKYKAELAGIALHDSLEQEKASASTYYEVTNLGDKVNGQHIESNPMIVDDKMYYTALKTDEKVYYKKKYDADPGDVETPKRKFYVAKKRDDGTWNTTGELPGVINSDEFDVSSGALSPEEDRFYFTRCAYEWNGKRICKIWVSERDDNDEWQEPEVLNDLINLAGYTSTHPSVGYDAKEGREVLYFVSDRPKGRGGLDIWAVSYDIKRDKYLNPLNCGKINTVGDEITPYYYADDSLLYFSSTGHPGFGGFDVFYNKGIRNKWENKLPTNVGIDINSSFDEQYFVPDGITTKGYFTSNRIGTAPLLSETCCDDIFYFEEKDKEPTNLLVKSNFAENNDCVEDYTIQVFKKTTNAASEYKPFKQLKNVDCEATINVSPNEEYKVKIIKDGVVTDSSFVQVATGEEIVPFLIQKETPDEPLAVVDDKTETNTDIPVKDEPAIETKKSIAPEETTPLDTNTSSATTTTSNTTTIEQPETTEGPTVLEVKDNNYVVPTYKQAQGGIILKDVYFDFDKSVLKPRSIEVLDNILIAFMKQYPDALVELIAHTDSYGSDNYNVVLAQKRARVVRDYIVSKGIRSNRLLYYGRGEHIPIKTNSTDDGRSYNRRTEFRVLDGSTNVPVEYSQEK